MLQGITNLRDVSYAVSLGAGNPGVEAWYVFGKDKYKFELGGGCTGVMAPGLYPLLRSGQINGLDRRFARRSGIRNSYRPEGEGHCRHGCPIGHPSRHHRARHPL